MNHGKPATDHRPQPARGGSAECADAARRAPVPPPPRDTEPSDTQPSDTELIAQAVAGDGVAFGRLVQRHQDRLYNALLRFTGSAEDAQDAAQEAFVQAYVKLDRFRSDASFYTWLYRIAMNRAISAGRKRRERVSLDAAGLAGGAGAVGGRPVDGGGPVCDAPPDAGAIAAERVQSVHAAIARLAEDQRQVLVLRELEGMDYRQIAEVIGAPIGTVRSRLSRARAQLREALAPLELEGS